MSDIFCDEVNYRQKIDSAVLFDQKEVDNSSFEHVKAEILRILYVKTKCCYLFLFRNYTGINFLPIIYFITKNVALKTPPIPLLATP